MVIIEVITNGGLTTTWTLDATILDLPRIWSEPSQSSNRTLSLSIPPSFCPVGSLQIGNDAKLSSSQFHYELARERTNKRVGGGV